MDTVKQEQLADHERAFQQLSMTREYYLKKGETCRVATFDKRLDLIKERMQELCQ
jgi:hypothetical protein